MYTHTLPQKQVSIFTALAKFDGATLTDIVKGGQLSRRRYNLKRLPPYLILHLARFTRNNFFVEKNPTIVNFPVKNLELRDCEH
jgi:U4/U6.U5 tri-snRNP-associated protein 2